MVYVVPFVIGMLLARDSIVGILIPSSISLPTSLFPRSVMLHPITNSLVTLLCKAYSDVHYQEGLEIPLRQLEWQILILIHIPTQQTPSETPVEHLYNHPVTLWRLVAHKVFLRYSGVAWSHSHRNMYSYGESKSNKLNDHRAKLTDG